MDGASAEFWLTFNGLAAGDDGKESAERSNDDAWDNMDNSLLFCLFLFRLPLLSARVLLRPLADLVIG